MTIRMYPFPIVFNLYLEDIECILDSQIGLTDPIIITNGLPLSCLLFSVNFQKCTGSSKTNRCPLNEYCNKWLLKINLIKTKALISQKENRKSTRDKYTFLNRNQIANITKYSYLGITFNSNGSF